MALNAVSELSSPLETLPADVVAKTLHYLQVPEWFNLSLSSKTCLHLTSLANLPKVAVISIRHAQGVIDLIRKLAAWKPIFCHQAGGHLCIQKIDVVFKYGAKPEDIERMVSEQSLVLDGVSSLDISVVNLKSDPDCDVLRGIALMCPNLKELDLSGLPDLGMRVSSGDLAFCELCPNLEKLTWDEASLATRGKHRPTLDLKGTCFRKATNLKELYLEESVLLGANTLFSLDDNLVKDFNAIVSSSEETTPSEEQQEDMVLLCECNAGLTRLDVKGVKYSVLGRCLPLPQHTLLKLVRCSPSLKWFRSDLSTENIAILQKERPNMTFVSSAWRDPSNKVLVGRSVLGELASPELEAQRREKRKRQEYE